MHPARARSVTGRLLHGTTWNWTCRLCTYSNPDDEDICCQQCGAAKR
ncbi:rubrerythrin [Nocardiopsis terrae]|uniref:Rubrerythrin n=1 Tax=Nocardiopsis terrae TaxID=372655 RepID=A0ABR9HEE3_9ACTN|nr:hypothetical protein [Nocardiopsis terrae]MBE1457404.1 rubrerythrin [Nocardiopsis terrae]